MRALLAQALASVGVLINDASAVCAEVFFRTSDYIDPPRAAMRVEPAHLMPRMRKVRMGLTPLTIEAGQENEVTIVAQRAFQPRHMVLTGANGTPGSDPLAAVALVYLRVEEFIIVDPERPLPATVFSPDMQGSSFEWPPVLPGSKLTLRYANYGQQPVTVLGTLVGREAQFV